MFMWWKGKLQPGTYDKLISAMDFYPTALDAADISIPKNLKLDGVSLLPWLQNKKLAKNKVPLYYVMDVAKQMHGNK